MATKAIYKKHLILPVGGTYVVNGLPFNKLTDATAYIDRILKPARPTRPRR